MKRNVYISYIDNESKNYKFKITEKFKGRKYKHSDESFSTENTKLEEDSPEFEKLRKTVSRSDVTVVLISRSILESSWIPYEIDLSLDDISDTKAQSKPKGVIGVVIPDKGNDYSYMMKKGPKGIWTPYLNKLPEILSSNIKNEKVVQNKNNIHYDSYISIYRWEDFIRNFETCVNSAYDKANNYFEDYNIFTL